MFCAHCGKPTAEDDAFCGNCGQPVGEAAAHSASPFQPGGASRAGGYVAGRFLDPDTGRPLAEWWKRALAVILDWVILAVPLFAFSHAGLHGASFWLSNFVISTLYFTLLIGSPRGQTVGMMALEISVRDAKSDTSIGFARALARYVVIYALGVALFLPLLIDYLSPLWDRRRQAWHDHAAGSIVMDLR